MTVFGVAMALDRRSGEVVWSTTLRDELPQNLRARRPLGSGQLSDACQSQIARIAALWKDCRTRFGGQGDALFGEFSIADVMYAPVALRFRNPWPCPPPDGTPRRPAGP